MSPLDYLQDFWQTGGSLLNTLGDSINNSLSIYNLNPGLMILLLFICVIVLLIAVVFRARVEQVTNRLFSFALIILALLFIVAILYVAWKYLMSGVL